MSRSSRPSRRAGSRSRTRAASSPRCMVARQAGRAGPRSLRRGRRQDAGARRGDGQQGPDLRDRQRPRRLAPIFERLQRAGTRNVQVREAGTSLDGLAGHMDAVLIDAPCTGSGTWRRRPDAKWRLSERALAERVADQAALLETAARYRQAGRQAGLRHLLASARGERRAHHGIRGRPAGFRAARGWRRDRRLDLADECQGPPCRGGAAPAGGNRADAAADRDGRLLRRRAQAKKVSLSVTL